MSTENKRRSHVRKDGKAVLHVTDSPIAMRIMIEAAKRSMLREANMVKPTEDSA